MNTIDSSVMAAANHHNDHVHGGTYQVAVTYPGKDTK